MVDCAIACYAESRTYPLLPMASRSQRWLSAWTRDLLFDIKCSMMLMESICRWSASIATTW